MDSEHACEQCGREFLGELEQGRCRVEVVLVRALAAARLAEARGADLRWTVGSDKFVQLSGPHAPTTDFSRQDWQPVFAER